jgi:undecaprenyl-phosphate 4-deoxy-4-formamido-L-arabinose transferase
MLRPINEVIIPPEVADSYGDVSLAEGVTVVVPVYNSECHLDQLVSRLEPVLVGLARPFEVILVNDGSRDGSWSALCNLAATRPWIRAFSLMRNYGQHNALLCGIRAARYSVIVTMDDDLQHPPEEIPKLLAKLNEGFDVVYGPPERMKHSLGRNILSRLTKILLARAMNVSNIRDINAFRAFRTVVRRGFANFRSPNPMIDVMLSWGTSRFGVVTVEHHPRRAGKSTYTLWTLTNQAMLLLTGFTTAPLRFASLFGFAFTGFGFAVLIYVAIIFLFFGSVPGFPFLASLIAIFGGAELFALGIVGEYLARVFNRTMERPGYVIESVVTADAATDDSDPPLVPSTFPR